MVAKGAVRISRSNESRTFQKASPSIVTVISVHCVDRVKVKRC
jgi:hypothetical protein